jgi:hypothetical protein
MPKQTRCYVVTREHYHYPPNDSDMVAATPIRVYPFAPGQQVAACVYAHQLATEQQKKFTGEVKEFQANSGRGEYRVWLDSSNVDADKFVYVVREVEYAG